jgi:type I restriction enzyme S subunit
MSAWRDTTLGEVVELKRGYDLPASNREPGEVPIVSSSGITGHHSVAKVSGPGVVTGRYGTLGQVFFIEGDFWPLNTALYVRDFKGNDPRFVAALLQYLQLGRNDGAAAVPGVNRNQLHGLPVRCPDIYTQRRIAVVLGTLDDLIENNRRRIKLSEQMMHIIYREWFVHFRYPGHQHAVLTDSPVGRIPEGWKVIASSELLEVNPRVKIDKALAYPFVTMADLSENSVILFPVGRRSAAPVQSFGTATRSLLELRLA